jgi:signal peptidase I
MNLKNIFKYIDPFTYLDLFLEKYIGEPNTKKNKLLYWIFYILYSFLLAYLLYFILSLIFGVSMPLAIVVSSSMEPNLYRGDLVIVSKAENLKSEVIYIDQNIANKDIIDFAKLNYKNNSYGLKEVSSIEINNQIIDINNTTKNDIIIYTSNIKNIDIVHRLIVYLKAKDGDFVLTKGDNFKTNRLIDQDCNIDKNTGLPKNLCLNIYPTSINVVKGKLIGKIPYIGYLKLIIFG